MVKWYFPSKANADVEGYSNPALEWFKGNPIRALAREICQNSLDAQNDADKPVRVEYTKSFVSTNEFPGMGELYEILLKCREFWKEDGNDNAHKFLDRAIEEIREKKICVLRISDFNTVGLDGPYEKEKITKWVGLVKGTAFSLKAEGDTASGSYGIGKAAPFINSLFQTVFYRTKNQQGETAAQGVAHLMSFRDESYGDPDPVRRSVGYYGESKDNMPVESMPGLDAIYRREDIGTDIFIPGFHFSLNGENDWVEQIIGEILENFLMAISYGNLSVRIEDKCINKDNLSSMVRRYRKYAKDAYCFSRILDADDEIVEERMDFHGMGTLRLRLIYGGDLNQKVLVVRKSGMKIFEIKQLPKGISFTGILEIEGVSLNAFFRKMENPTHDKWEPERHPNKKLARQYKKEVENWVRDMIRKKLEELSGDEVVVDTGNIFNTLMKDEGKKADGENVPGNAENCDRRTDKSPDNLIDSAISVETLMNIRKSTPVQSLGGNSKRKVPGSVNTNGNLIGVSGHRGGKKPQNRIGRNGINDPSGNDSMYDGISEVDVKARVIGIGKSVNRLIFVPDKNLSYAEVEVLATGENGKSFPIKINSIEGGISRAEVRNGKIVVRDIKVSEKIIVDFKVPGDKEYAMGVIVSGN